MIQHEIREEWNLLIALLRRCRDVVDSRSKLKSAGFTRFVRTGKRVFSLAHVIYLLKTLSSAFVVVD
jgi:hypothetical protein